MPQPRKQQPFAFVAEPLDRSDALRDDPAKLAGWWPYSRVIALDADGKALTNADDSLREIPGLQLEARHGIGHDAGVFLGVQRKGDGSDECGWFALPAEIIPDAGETRVDLRTAAAQWPQAHATLFAQARAVLHWRARHKFCSACGGELAFTRGGWEARCARCGAVHYPRTDPAVIVAVTDGERLLLGRAASWPARRYSTLAGFVEPGETLEQAVAREVLEETAVRVQVESARYLASQPWPFPGSLMLGFIVHAEPDTPQINDELEDARWFSREEVGAALRGDGGAAGLEVSPWISISRWLVEQWYATSASGGS